jgi:peptidoglycan/xylan/chitin deacetylase (PgdA/CDA1 family)
VTESRGRASVTYLIGRKAGSPMKRRLSFWLFRFGLWLAASLAVLLPVGATLKVMGRLDGVVAPATIPRLPAASVSDAERVRWRSIGTPLPATAPPIVLAYHDVRPNPKDRYVVTPEVFERQLTALSEAGFHTISSAEYAAYLRGAPVAPRSVYLTFDDGTGGLYLYADQILERLGMRAASYLISGRVGTHRPYYLSWPEIHTMAGSGRWDFQAHTHDLHTRGPVGAEKKDGSLLTGRAWDPKTGQPETDEEHARRVRADVAAQLDDFAREKMPKPILFAYPFSDLGPRDDRGAVDVTAQIIDSTYVAAFTNKAATVAPTSRRSSAGGELQRIEVFGDTQPDDLATRVANWTAIAPGATAPLTDQGRWWDAWTGTVPAIGVFRGQAPPPAGKSYLQATYAPYATADWTGYRIVAGVRGLVRRGNNANVTVRVGGTGSLTVRTSHNGAQVVSDTGAVLTTIEAEPAARHVIEVSVTAKDTKIKIDDKPPRTIPGTGGPRSTGGFGIALRREAGNQLPAFNDVTVTALGADSR